MNITCRTATTDDVPLLAGMNRQLIIDEGHRNPMTQDELQARMTNWLAGEYQGAIASVDSQSAGYALYRHDPGHVYLRQFYIDARFRRRGVGRTFMQWLQNGPWQHAGRIRLEVLTGNAAGIAFWHAMGFRDYCITMEREL